MKGALGTVVAFWVPSVCRRILKNAWIQFSSSGAEKGPMFLWLGIKQTTTFLFSPQIICQTKGSCHGEKSTIFPAFAPFGAPLHSMLSEFMHFHSSGSNFQPAEMEFAVLECESHLLPLRGLLTPGKVPRMAPAVPQIQKDS